MDTHRSSEPCCRCGIDTVLAAHQVRPRQAGLASASGQRDWPVAAWRHPTRPWLGTAASVVATAMDRNTVTMSWRWLVEGHAGRLVCERVDLGWVGPAAAPVLCGGPAVTGGGAGRHGPPGPGGGRGRGPPGEGRRAG